MLDIEQVPASSYQINRHPLNLKHTSIYTTFATLSQRLLIWNTIEIVTARKAFWDATHELTYQRTTAMLTPEEHSAESTMEFEPTKFSNTGKSWATYRLIEQQKMQYEKFGGLTFYE